MNGLKQINDTLGHKAGDDHIREASKLICDIFKHSPVFRIGGDEFTVILRGSDYDDREALCKTLSEQIEKNNETGGVVIACGISEFIPGSDKAVSAVFERADELMYANKKQLKANK